MRIARHWRLNAQRYALEGVKCSTCSTNIFPPREVCPHCEQKIEQPYALDARLATRRDSVSAVLEHAAR